jgi:hypothetical protein
LTIGWISRRAFTGSFVVATISRTRAAFSGEMARLLAVSHSFQQTAASSEAGM